MRRFFKHLRFFTIKPHEIDAESLIYWDTRIVSSLIEKLGVKVGYIKTEQFDDLFVAYFDCMLHKKSKYMLDIQGYDVFHATTIDEITISIGMRKKGVKCECFKSKSNNNQAQGIMELLSYFIRGSGSDEDADDIDEPVAENCIEIPNINGLKEFEVLFNKKRQERNRTYDAVKVKNIEEEIQKIAHQIINF
ncbi:hypothetical protein ACKWTF_010971 [Chironomus riparius]